MFSPTCAANSVAWFGRYLARTWYQVCFLVLVRSITRAVLRTRYGVTPYHGFLSTKVSIERRCYPRVCIHDPGTDSTTQSISQLFLWDGRGSSQAAGLDVFLFTFDIGTRDATAVYPRRHGPVRHYSIGIMCWGDHSVHVPVPSC